MTQNQSKLQIIIEMLKEGDGVEGAVKALDKLDKQSVKSKKSASTLSNAWSAAGIAAAAIGVRILKSFPALSEQAIKFKNTQIALSAYTGSVEAAEKATEAILDVTGRTISEFTATQNATKLFSLGLANNSSEAAKLTDIAIRLGATMGKDVTQSFEEFSLLLANQSILRLDTFGISANSVRVRMAELAEEFPDLDKQARFLNSTLEIAGEKLGSLEAVGFKASSGFDVLRASTENFKLSFGESFSKSFDSAAKSMAGFVDSITAASKAENEIKEARERGIITAEEEHSLINRATFTNFTYAEALEVVREKEAALDAENEALAASQGKLIEATEETIAVFLDEEDILSALSAALKGPMASATEKLTEAQQELTAATIEITKEQEALKAEFGAGEIKADEYNESLASLQERKDELTEQVISLGESLKETTRELIFQQVAAELDAETSLKLARELGLVDEATFAVAEQARLLRVAYDEGALSSSEFAEQARILAEDVDKLQGKDVKINADTLAANRSVNAFKSNIASVPTSRTTTLFTRRVTPDVFGGRHGFQEGGQFQIPDQGPLGDRVPVEFVAERGETVTITPRDGTPPATAGGAGGSGSLNIENVFLGSQVSLEMFTAQVAAIL